MSDTEIVGVLASQTKLFGVKQGREAHKVISTNTGADLGGFIGFE